MRDPNAMPRWHITTRLRLADGSFREEDLGVHAAWVGHRAKSRAIAMHAGRMGWPGGRRGPKTGKWIFRIELDRNASNA